MSNIRLDFLSAPCISCLLGRLVRICMYGQTTFFQTARPLHSPPTNHPAPSLRAHSSVSLCSRHLLVKPRSQGITVITLQDAIYLWYLHKGRTLESVFSNLNSILKCMWWNKCYCATVKYVVKSFFRGTVCISCYNCMKVQSGLKNDAWGATWMLSSEQYGKNHNCDLSNMCICICIEISKYNQSSSQGPASWQDISLFSFRVSVYIFLHDSQY